VHLILLSLVISLDNHWLKCNLKIKLLTVFFIFVFLSVVDVWTFKLKKLKNINLVKITAF